MDEMLTYYASQSPLSDPGPYAHLFDALPYHPADLAATVQGLLIHKYTASCYHINLTSIQRSEQRLRTVRQRLERMLEIDSAPLSQARPAELRQVGVCRDFALLHVSMLRHRHIPARMRVGFATYLDPEAVFHIDHWISEYWDAEGKRWVLFDPQIDDPQRQMFHIKRDVHDLVRDQDFFPAGSAWQRCRAGQDKPLLFRFNGHWKGMPCIRGNLLHDFQALNKTELGVFDYWDELGTKSDDQLAIEEKTLLDRIASLTFQPEGTFTEMRSLYDELPRTRRIEAHLQRLGIMEGPPVDPQTLRSSDAGCLASLADLSEAQAPSHTLPTRVVYEPFELEEGHPGLSFTTVTTEAGDILVRGARQHNLKNINVRIPRNKLTVVTGVSGSGKSSLAFDTLYAEGQRRYGESLSSYARQFMDQMEKPQVDHISGLSPAVAIEQKTVSRNPRSTVGTVTEILDYLRVLFARLGMLHCPRCGRAVQPQSAQQITNQLSHLPAGRRFQLLAPLARSRKGTYAAALKAALKDGFARARINGQIVALADGIPELEKDKKHTVELLVDRLVVPAAQEDKADFKTRLMDSIETCLKAGQGELIVAFDDEEILLSEHNSCPHCEISFSKLEPHLFSFNSPLGMCDACNGLGVVLQVDPDLVIEHPELSLLDGASRWYRDLRKKGEGAWTVRSLNSIARHYGVNLETPWKDLPEQFRNVILYGSSGEKVHFSFEMEAFTENRYRTSKESSTISTASSARPNRNTPAAGT